MRGDGGTDHTDEPLLGLRGEGVSSPPPAAARRGRAAAVAGDEEDADLGHLYSPTIVPKRGGRWARVTRGCVRRRMSGAN